MLIKTLFFIFAVLKYTNSARILGVFPFGAVSHYILASKLMKGLAEAGHEVTMISPYKLKDPPINGNYTDIILEGFEEELKTTLAQYNLFVMEEQNSLQQKSSGLDMMMSIQNKTIHDKNVRKLLQSHQKFDVVIMEQFVNDALKVFAHLYKCPLVILSCMGPSSLTNPTVGNPQPVSTVPNIMLQKFSADSMSDRAKNALFYIIEFLANNYYVLPKEEKIMLDAFPDAPSLKELYTNVSLVLLNSHTSLNPAVPTVPNMVEIGGYFIDPAQKLPNDLQDFLDNAENGVIYFNMGTNLNSKDMSEQKKTILLNVFGRLKEKVLWKFEGDLPGKPKNVMIRKWLPQQDILAHPNIKLFITHGGLLSTIETIHNGVPILAIPVFGDQPTNADRAVADGFGLKLGYFDQDFTEEKFRFLVDELLNNPKYKENVQRRSKIYHDRPQKPLETAIYWVEYVIRHKGAPHLRVAGVRMPWYQYFMVDVIAVIILSFLIILYGLKSAYKKLFCKNRNSTKLKTN